MKPDVSNREDIEIVVRSFYEKVKADETIGFFFTKVIPVDWKKHLPLMCSFWENVLFFSGNYEGNPIATHRNINQQFPTKPEHFQKWMELFSTAVDDLFAGPNADKMKQHAASIAAVMMQKI
ncbi:MAG TPA: group III truncated hemoglobin [Niabella sp.]|nr:group III truncated hemoglobin [Niabella sp.]